MFRPKKLGLVSVISTLMTCAKGENIIVLDRVLCIHYPVLFQKRGKKVTKTLIDSGNEVNAITPAYTKQPGLQIRQTNVGAQKIDNSSPKIFGIIIAGFEVI